MEPNDTAFKVTPEPAPSSPRTPARRTLIAVLASLTMVLPTAPAAASEQTDTGQHPRTIVSFTLDDGSFSQFTAADVLAKHRMAATFYIVSGAVGTPGYLTRTELDKIAAQGHEIGGHTVTHPRLPSESPDETRRQICQDRNTLTSWGFHVTSFAFPYGETDGATQAAVRDCGYNSARLMSDLRSAKGCLQCPPFENIPPRNPYAIRSTGMVDPTWTLEDLKNLVTTAEQTGGWVPIVLHQTCDTCGNLALSPAVLDQFAQWLGTRKALGTAVRTVDQVMGGKARPLVPAPPPATREGLPNPSLEEATDSVPNGWDQTQTGNNTPVWTRTSAAHTGRWAQRLDVTTHTSGDAKLLVPFDLGEFAPPAHPDRRYELGAWYTSTARTQFAVYYRKSSGSWGYWTSSPFFPPTSGWTRAQWITPPAPPDASAVSFGLALSSQGSLTTDDYSLQPVQEASCHQSPWWSPRRWFCW